MEKNKHIETKQHATKKYSVSMKKSKRKFKITLRLRNIKTQLSKSMGCSKSSFKREVNSDTSLSQETNKYLK